MIERWLQLATSGMNLWLWAALAMLLAVAPAGIVAFRGNVEDRLVGLEFATPIIVLFLVLLIEGFNHPAFFDLPLTLTMLSFGSGIVFVRFLQRWE